jgi:DNA-binding response OmpR family regulator
MRRQLSRSMPDLVLLDVQLPGPDDGFALARWLRESNTRVGIIMLTASADPVDKVLGLESGADDYVAKPHEPRALLARIKAVLRRAGGAEAATTGERVRMGKCLLDLQSRRLVALTGEEIPLRAGEYELLKLFAENPNRPLSRDWLLETTSHREMEAFDRAIDIRIVNTHLESRRAERAERLAQATRIVAHLDELDAPASLLLGDLNASDEPDLLDAFSAYGLRDSWMSSTPSGGATAPSTQPVQRLDYVLVGPDCRVVKTEVPAPSPHWSALSDHLPVVVDLSWG